ncbi:MAG: hypothetical protein ACK559_21205, partial [bacterium]
MVHHSCGGAGSRLWSDILADRCARFAGVSVCRGLQGCVGEFLSSAHGFDDSAVVAGSEPEGFCLFQQLLVSIGKGQRQSGCSSGVHVQAYVL